jgi:hypothetical protein
MKMRERLEIIVPEEVWNLVLDLIGIRRSPSRDG